VSKDDDASRSVCDIDLSCSGLLCKSLNESASRPASDRLSSCSCVRLGSPREEQNSVGFLKPI